MRYKMLGPFNIRQNWVNAVSPVVRKGETLESSFQPPPAHGDDVLDPSGPHSS